MLALAAEVLAEVSGGAVAAYRFSPTTERVGWTGDADPPDLPERPAAWQAPSRSGDRVDLPVHGPDGEAVGLLRLVGGDAPDPAWLRTFASTTATAVSRAARVEALLRRNRHFVEAQRISHVGSYDFDIATGLNQWSDQLYRIYGREPGSFNADYERFLSMVHPDDREHVIATHQASMATLSPYQMEERVIWPDGSVHTLASWGEVVPDAEGRPARMVGICWDISEEKATAEALRRTSEQLSQVVEAAPDVVLVIGADGTVKRANRRLPEVLGHAPADVVGQPLALLLPDAGADGTALTALPREALALHRDGHEVPVEVSCVPFETAEGPATAAFLRDLTERRRTEELALLVHDAQVRRQHALEINDNVVQGLASVLYLLDLGRTGSAADAAQATLNAAQAMMDDLLSDLPEQPLPAGSLLRSRAHGATLDELVPAARSDPDAARVLVVDDAVDLRVLLRIALADAPHLQVVGEAEDGRQAVEQARLLQPDVVLLDLSMPVMDGITALPQIRRACPSAKVLALSGFDAGRMRQEALDAGADGYLEKGGPTAELVAAVEAMLPRLVRD